MARFFRDAVPARNTHGRLKVVPLCRKAHRLAMVAPGRRDYSWGVRLRLPQMSQIDQAASNLECPDWTVVFVLEPQFQAQALVQQGPRVLWGRVYRLIDDRARPLDLIPGNELARARRIEQELRHLNSSSVQDTGTAGRAMCWLWLGWPRFRMHRGSAMRRSAIARRRQGKAPVPLFLLNNAGNNYLACRQAGQSEGPL